MAIAVFLSFKNDYFSYSKIPFFSLLLWIIRDQDISRSIKLNDIFFRIFLDFRKLPLHWCLTYILSSFAPMSHQFDMSIDMFCYNWHCFNTITTQWWFHKKIVRVRCPLCRGSHFSIYIFPTDQNKVKDDKKPNRALLSLFQCYGCQKLRVFGHQLVWNLNNWKGFPETGIWRIWK